MDLDLLRADIAEASDPIPSEAPQAKPLSELVRHSGNDPDELLKSRYLSRGGGLLIVAPTGVGKSAFAMQCMVLWAVGREAFGITPARPLKSVLIQAENDEGDLAEMRDGVVHGLRLDSTEAERACSNIFVCREDSKTRVAFFTRTVEPLLKEHAPDLLWIDPALSYIGGEVSSQRDVGEFLRNLLNPLLREHQCGGVVIHHTNKPPSGKEKPDWAGGDFAYLGSGSAEWANWSRAVLCLRSLGGDVYELRAGKRGGRLGWTEADGTTRSFCRFIGHSEEPGIIYWRELAEGDVPANQTNPGRPERTKLDVLAHVPIDKPITKNTLIERCKAGKIGEKRTRALIDELLGDCDLYEWRIRRRGTNPEIRLSRFPQPENELSI